MSTEACVCCMPSSPGEPAGHRRDQPVAGAGGHQHRADLRRCAARTCASAAPAAASASCSRLAARCSGAASMPVLALISAALIGDQEKLALRMTSSLQQTCSPRTTASASSTGCTRNASRHPDRRVGAHRRDRLDRHAAPDGRARLAAPERTRSMNAVTSRLRGWNAITKSSSPIVPAGAQLGARAVPRVLVVQHHRPPGERLQLGHRSRRRRGSRRCGNDRVVRVVVGQHEGQRVRGGQELGDRRLDRPAARWRGGACAGTRRRAGRRSVSSVSASQVGGSALVGALAPRPTLRSPSSHGVSTGRNTSSRRRGRSRQRVGPLVEHRDRVPVDPEQVLRQVAQQLEAAGVGRRTRRGPGCRCRSAPWPRSRARSPR